MNDIVIKNKEIKLNLPKMKFNKYLLKIDRKISDNINMNEIEALFLLAVEDFEEGVISLDDLSGVCNYLWSLIPAKDKFSTKLAETLFGGAEMSYYVRQVSDKEAALIFNDYLRNVLRYKAQYRKII